MYYYYKPGSIHCSNVVIIYVYRLLRVLFTHKIYVFSIYLCYQSTANVSKCYHLQCLALITLESVLCPIQHPNILVFRQLQCGLQLSGATKLITELLCCCIAFKTVVLNRFFLHICEPSVWSKLRQSVKSGRFTATCRDGPEMNEW